MMKENHNSLQKIIYYVYGFLVLWEWLRPLDEVTDTGNLSIFLYFIALSYLLSYFSVPFVVSFSAKVLLIAYFIHDLFFDGGFFSQEWISAFFSDIVTNFFYMMNADWWEMTNSFRSLLFFVLLWLLAYLMEYWIVQLKKILLFLLMTITYLAVLDTFTPYDSDQAIVRMVVFGFIILGLLKLDRLKEQESLFVHKKLWMKWLVPLITVTVLTTTVGYFAPKAAPVWPDPIPFLTGNGEAGGGVKRIGYGTNDSTLGGPFIGDDTVVFTVETANREYWRVETKDVYTGKGWESEEPNFVTETDEKNVSIPLVEQGFQGAPAVAKFDMNIGYSHITYPVQLQSVETDYEIVYDINLSTQKISTKRSGELFPVDSYSVVYTDPRYILEDLKASSIEYPEEVLRYTQLPEDLPERVGELAQEIILPHANRYDQVKAVENYFRLNGFEYDTTNVAVPGKNDDYVDQFLFETKIGYCDNFSTSMIVLLRSAGIPARWVKGYTGGEYLETTTNNTRMYEVKNENAHSWVEVYFTGIGWVPFEPTKGFTNPYDFTTNQEKDETAIPAGAAPEDKPETPEEDLLAEEELGKDAGSTFSVDITVKDVMIFVIVLLIIGVILYFTRNKWMPIYVLKRYGKFRNGQSFEKSYFILIKLLRSYGIKKKDHQTLREYAAYVDSFFYTKDMRKLTVKLEGIQYRKNHSLEDKDIKQLQKLWENLIKRIAS
ncbi:transglutaminase-like domain-containing protein [Bacillus suaedaesalsae]|uniref:Transglutaminase family protein n=1 Tax=Bacillus suaedaesalsae TaxID=2810349 RepID=A0ABS2DJF6_9BACI|nr:transglutaminase family protein [Bacillus suaedaesalsae]MBM6618624.1 transglutaminase family protein [Bacillus suaedaesalsae]